MILPLVVFRIDGERYALPLSAVERVLPMVAVAPLPKAPVVAIGIIDVQGRVVPVVDLRRRFARPPRAYGLAARLLLARTARRSLALAADEVLGPAEVPAETVVPPDAVLPGIGHIAGIAAQADGLLFIHDLETLLSTDEERQLAEALGQVEG